MWVRRSLATNDTKEAQMGLGFNRAKFKLGIGQAGSFFANQQPAPYTPPAPQPAPAPAPGGTWLDNRFGNQLTYKPAPIPAGENVQGTWYGSVDGVGSSFALTDNHLAVSPVDTDKARKLLVWGARLTGMNGVGVANTALQRSGLLEPRTVPLSDVASVEPLPRRRLQAPGARLNLSSGEHVDLRVNATPFTPNMSRKNTDSYAQALALLRTALANQQAEPQT
jgi:hypothetical protein